MKSIAPYFGGKCFIAKEIAEIIDAAPHTLYAEPFVGMGSVFFARQKPVAREVVNDLDGEISNLWRIIQRHARPFMQELRFVANSSRELMRLRRSSPAEMTDLERAVRTFVLARLGFNGQGNLKSPTWSYHFHGGERGNSGRSLMGFARDLVKLRQRLEHLRIDNLDWAAFINRYDRNNAFFYIDPPYPGHEKDYRASFASWPILAARCKSLKGAFLLSVNDSDEVRTLFHGCHIRAIDAPWFTGRAGMRTARELLISNRALPRKHRGGGISRANT
jgi:DNA adenine methylase